RPLTSRKLHKLRLYLAKIYNWLYFPPLVIFVAMMFVTYWAFRASLLYIERDQNASISAVQADISSAIENRLNTYEEIIIGGAGLFRSSTEVTEKEWDTYLATYQIDQRYPGVQSIGYIKTFTRAELSAVTRFMRSQGFTDFKLNPAT